MKRSLKIVLLLAAIVLLQGCWDKRELTDLLLITAIGIDKGKDTDYELSYQIVNPINVTGGLQGGQGGDRPPVSSYSVTGNNLTEMSRHASAKVSREIYYSHTNLVVVDEKLAKGEGLIKILDVLDRDTDFRSTATIIISRGQKAKTFIRTLTPIDKIPSNKVNKTLQFTEEHLGEHMKTSVQDVVKCLTSKAKHPIISSFKVTGNKEKGEKMENVQSTSPEAIVEADGLAVIKEGKLVNWLEGKTARGVLWLRNKISRTYLTITLNHEKDAVTFDVIRQKTKVRSHLKNGKPAISVDVDMEGDIGETTVPIHLDDPKVLSDIERKVAKELKNELQNTIDIVKRNKTDVLQFGDIVYRNHPKVWKKMEGEWSNRYFPDTDVDITVNAYIRRTGLRNNPNILNHHEGRS
ncbi:MAG: Ger(x)C family spore germination protein [Bacillus sp. (in: Bacteria)]|uniref:Ger(x)C family spore germination protein n=1 Tax=Bacillus TaxID=1386 RepID=UPI0003A79A83|nr:MULTISPECIES: Ger(x)C family spore germination protein [Bacillus]ETB72366.1 spore germination protein KC [Bacillus sp. CPSM8]MBC8622973.1 Ger(x)C family spore germination protein [Robertmurraya crescens]MBL7478088.1 Ger(x)C family spore germination protein [Bacillus paralicheniformis]MBW4886525.1 Ger(x)C family spore germination protein [Bacillus sp. (in: firmicutes)]MCW4364905.1 Ger(x)C family spore germination protein [Bacillus paralicheniformis]